MRVRFPDASGNQITSGTLVVLFTEPVSDVAITIDGVLAVQGAHTQRVVIEQLLPIAQDKSSDVAKVQSAYDAFIAKLQLAVK